MKQSMRILIKNLDLAEIESRLAEDPQLANEGIPLAENDLRMAHPLHRLCDNVINGIYRDEDAVQIARLFLKYGARVDGNGLEEKKDTPLIAAASLLAEQTGILYVDSGANIHHAGTHGGTALHWSAWVGKEKLLQRLITAGADIHYRCSDFMSTPLFWAVHGYASSGETNRHNQVACVRILLQAGADKNVPNASGKKPVALLNENDTELLTLLQ